MKPNSILIGIFALALILQMNDFKALNQRQQKLADHIKQIIKIAKKPIHLPQLKGNTVIPILSKHDKKLIDDASVMAFEKLKNHYAISSRSRFG